MGNNNNGGSGESVGGARSSIGPIEISVCIVSTNEKPSWREHRARDKSLKRCTFENVLTTKQDQSEIEKKTKTGKKVRSQEVGAEASQTQIGLTGGGKDDHMIHLSGLPHHKVASNKIIEEIISLVENKSKELRKN